MAQQKWLKVGAAAILSAGMLAACGGEEDEPEMEQETDVMPGENQGDSEDNEDDEEDEED
ncbi:MULTISPECIES: hypothetical protein [unclassified Planococcus (in: firmicutes)]|uniref:hypothetical protein n=1 Tax=unclassified Planococcus (in: firmicutes) TaxID=2662419 RepID=UPI000C320D96|nr:MULTISPECIES: hypothetical protein [unclassified Planococcus (in: firmicutes)]AUD15120.1 hypothetical protein CW734_17365 [Planococcus sp. MB-3u-03]PKG46253.1 hypothetical protein CXF66_07665 [Planococcus sp. Urea-trap-24]PKG90039.1 hypothetical protein CXF91_04010 [Planococcus sp. Urea-3u-39]PKH35751.1 hypothetical protein CXF77_16440 [Planococcus sp. MB-3u-09]